METLTKNNSGDMKTVVETYVIEETAELIYDDVQLKKWNEMVDELSLTGQRSTVRVEGKSPIPFMHMKEGLVNVFLCLCPCRNKVDIYNKTPIPLEILELVSLSKREGYFDTIEIWYDDKSPDPACVGINKLWGEWNNYSYNSREEAIAAGINCSDYSYRENKYLLGRWADVKCGLDELKEKAVKRFIEAKTIECKEGIKYHQRNLEDMEDTVKKQFS